MLGTFRLVLALLVALSHANVRIAGFNPGVTAVVCFYIISGYVMTGLLQRHYLNGDAQPVAGGAHSWLVRCKQVCYFYLDRALRIFPQYLVVAGLTLTWFLIVGKPTAFLHRLPGARDLLFNVGVAPLNYYMFNASDQFTLIPPAWSLGAEIQFYLVLPIILLCRLRIIVFIGALAVISAAAWGTINSEFFGYRLLPGVLVYFLCGSALYEHRYKARTGSALVLAGIAVTGLAVILLNQFNHLMLPYNRETLLGLAIGLPLVYWLGRLPQRALDTRLGDLSYGVFLNHFLIQWAVLGEPFGWRATIAYLLCSMSLSLLTQQAIEKPILRWRHRLRRQPAI
jgi:peptidoglycan/LPS O-acetylase OafA/YrhL